MKYKVVVIVPDEEGNFELPDGSILVRALPQYSDCDYYNLRVLMPIIEEVKEVSK